MAKTPSGAMSASNAVPHTFSEARGNPPRYTHLTHSEAWAKIDEEEKALIARREEIAINAKVKERLAQLGATSSDAPEKETPKPVFDSAELVGVMTELQSVVNITNANPVAISATIAGVNVEIRKV